jgi:hypothetical protein
MLCRSGSGPFKVVVLTNKVFKAKKLAYHEVGNNTILK